MTQPLQDNGRPVRQGDPSFVFRGVYHPIVWYNGEPYRPRVETLVIKNSRYVYLKMYSDKEASKQERLSPYELPGGSIDADCDRLKQAENEVNEEILAEVKNIYQTNVQYFEVFSDENVEMYKKESPLSYRGFVTDVFCAEYAGKFDANKVEDKDLDPEMQQGGWYAITLVADKLSEPHMEAILQCPFVDNSVKQTLRLYYNKPKESVTEATGVKKPIYVVNMHYKSLFGNAVRRFTGSDFNHSAISFDSTLSEMYTFIREKTSDDERPNGFSVETIDSMLNKDKNTMIKVVRFDIPEDNYNALAERIGHNKRNNTSGYDFSTIIRVPIKLDKTTDDGKFVCSTFVANSLKTAGVRLQKPVNLMTPDDVSKVKGGIVAYDGRLDEYGSVKESVTEKTIYNNEGEVVPEVCPKCGSKVGIFIQGEPVYLCTNKECRNFFGVVPFNSVEEGYIFDDKTVYLNTESVGEIANKNILFITGLSGGGKSTFTNLLVNNNDNVVVVHLDEMIGDTRNKNHLSKIDKNVFKLLTAEYGSENKFYETMKSWQTDEVRDNYELIKGIIIDFIMKVIKMSRKAFSMNKLILVEGVQLYNVGLDNRIRDTLAKSAMIILGSSVSKSAIRGLKRDKGDSLKYKLKRIPWLIEENGYLKKFREYMITHADNVSYYSEWDGLLSNFSTVEEMKRSELPNEVFGVPEQRKYPLESEKHVRSAIKLFNHVDKKYEAELAKNIIKKMDEYGIGDIEVGPNNRFGNYYKSSVREGLLEASLKSTIDKDFKPKGKKSLSSFQRVKITKSNIKQYTAMTGNLLRHTNPNDNIYLYLDNGNPVGAVSVESEALSDGTKWITGIEVMEEYQGYGLGNQLLDVVMYEFGGNGLTCVKGNDIAKRMYEKRGFKARNPKGEIDKLSGLVVYYMYLPEVFPNGLNESYMVATKKPKKFFNVTEATSIKKTTYTAFTIKEADKVADKLIKDSNPTIQSFGHSLKRGILSNFENFVDILGKINGLFYAGLVVTPYMLSVVVSTLLLLVTSTPYSLIASALEKQKRFLRNAVRKEDKYLQKYHDVLDIVIRSEGIESVTESFSIVMEAPANEEDTAEDENDAVTDYTDEVEDEEDPGEDNDNVTDYTDEVDTDEEDASEEETPDENDEVTDYTDEVDPEEDEPTPTAADDGGETTDDTDTTTADTGETDADTDTGTGDNTDAQATDDAGEEDPGAGDETEGETTDDVDTATDYTDEDTVDDAETDDAETTDNTADEAGTDEENGDSNQNSIVKNYNLILDFQQLYRLLEDLTTTLEATVFKSPIQNVALAQIIKNMKRLRESVSNYIEFNFGNDYTMNLYNYNIFLKALKLILEMLQTTKDLVTDNSNK